MKRLHTVQFNSDKGKKLITLSDDAAKVEIYSCTADELDELSTACAAAAEELRAIKVRIADGAPADEVIQL